MRPAQVSTPLRKLENVTEPVPCAACGAHILDRYLLEAIDKYWHEDCLRVSARLRTSRAST